MKFVLNTLTFMKIQLSPTRIVKDAVTVWYEHGPEVDIVMDLKALSFAENSIDALFAFHVLDHFFPNEVDTALKNWRKILKPKGNAMYIVVDDFEYIARAFVGGDITVDLINSQHACPSHFTQDNLIAACKSVGFIDEAMKLWYADMPDGNNGILFPKTAWELVLSAEKYE